MNQMDVCSVCKAKVKTANMSKHLKKVHSEYSPTRVDKDPADQKKHKRVMYRCKQCHRLYGEAATSRHMKNAHLLSTHNISDHHKYFFEKVEMEVIRSTRNQTPTTSTDKQKQATLRKDSEAYKNIKGNKRHRLDLKVRCSICGNAINYKNAKSHYKKVHNWDLKASKRYAEEEPTILENKQSSNEWFNRFKIYNAGAYGLGKNRKH